MDGHIREELTKDRTFTRVIGGDFNYPDIDWTDLTAGSSGRREFL